MPFISYQLVNKSYQEDVKIDQKQIRFFYPCTTTYECTDYEITLLPGVYRIELYGASGGHYNDSYITSYRPKGQCYDFNNILIEKNVDCTKQSSSAGAGGYTSGIIRIRSKTKAFLSLGGEGQYKYKIEKSREHSCYLKENMIEGGYNGGGWSSNFYSSPKYFGSGSGGGASDLKFDENDLFHRVIVAGGGGGSDDFRGTDGSGGAGGGLKAQGFTIEGTEYDELIATQSSGFSFGYGESVEEEKSKHPNSNQIGQGSSDRAGAGGGWYGGFASQQDNGGAGGGSSFILTSSSELPNQEITVYDSFYNYAGKGKYAFSTQSKYIFSSPILLPGVWKGNGFAIFTQISSLFCLTKRQSMKSNYFIYVLILI